jgi:hypothetical protein
MRAVRCFKTTVSLYQTTRSKIPEDSTFCCVHRENTQLTQRRGPAGKCEVFQLALVRAMVVWKEKGPLIFNSSKYAISIRKGQWTAEYCVIVVETSSKQNELAVERKVEYIILISGLCILLRTEVSTYIRIYYICDK